MRELNRQDLNWVVKHLPSKLVAELKGFGGIFIAGGFIRSIIAKESINDIDLFATSKDNAKAFAAEFSNDTPIVETDNAISFHVQGRLVQIIHRWTFEVPQNILTHFDFTVAQAVIWLEKDSWKSLASDSYYEDLAAKRLVYTNPPNAEFGSSLLRLLKYRAKGYNPTLKTIGEIVAGTAGLESPDEIIRQLREIDPHSTEVNEQV